MYLRVNSVICNYTMLFSCQCTGILKGETEKMRRFGLAIALACLLSGVTRAGEIHTTGAVTPPPPSTATSSVATTGEVPSTGATAPQESDALIEILMALLGIVP